MGLDREEGVGEAGARVSVYVGGAAVCSWVLEPWELESERHGGDGGGRWESRRGGRQGRKQGGCTRTRKKIRAQKFRCFGFWVSFPLWAFSERMCWARFKFMKKVGPAHQGL
jgi:hypothetical protein